MTSRYSDNFDSDTIGTLPAGWVNISGAAVVSTVRPVSGAQALSIASGGDGAVALYTGIAAMADMEVRSDHLAMVSGVDLPNISHIMRMDAGFTSGYMILLLSRNGAAYSAYLFKRTGSSFTAISEIGTGVSVVAGDIVHVATIVTGSNIGLTIWKNSETRPSVVNCYWSDSSIAAPGYAGTYNALGGATSAVPSIDNFVIDDLATAATAITMTGPGSGTMGTPSTNFTVGANGPITGTVVVTPNDAGGGGTFSPSTVSISSGSPTGTFTYTASSSGAKTIAATNNGGLTNPTAITYTASSSAATAVTMSGPTGGVSGVASSNFTVGANGTITGTIVVTPSDSSGGGTFTPTTVSLSSASPTGTFTYTPASTGAKTISVTNNRSLTNPGSITYTASAGANNALLTANMLFSPYNWNLGTATAKTINAGAYFKAVFGGTACALNFDMTGIATPVPQISYRIDRFGPWITVPIAASVALTVPADTSDYANKGGHLLEVIVKSMTETQARWATQATAVSLTGVILDAGKVIGTPPALPLKAIFYGDSITEGVRTVNSTASSDTDRNDSGQCWSLEVGRILGAEVGNVGFGGAGFNVGGSGSVPSLPYSYNFLYSGVTRSFTSAPDFIVLMMGTNDSASVTANATAVLNGLLAATTGTKMIVLRPFGGTAHAAELQAAIAACTAPARCTYVDTAGFFATTNSADGTHPYGNENIAHIAPLVAAVIKPILAGGPALTSRTVTLNLGTASGPASSLTGLHVAFYDEASPELQTTARYQSATQTTDSAGNLAFTVMSTLASGGAGSITVKGTGVHYNGTVAVA